MQSMGDASRDPPCSDDEPPTVPTPRESGIVERPRRALTIFIDRIPRHELAAARAELEALERDDPLPPIERPRTRADCIHAPRPCPFVGCRHHLYLDVSRAGHIKLRFDGLDVDEIPETCALDVVVEGEAMDRQAIGRVLNLTRERVRQIEPVALAKLAERLGLGGRRLPLYTTPEEDEDGDDQDGELLDEEDLEALDVRDEDRDRADEDLDDVAGHGDAPASPNRSTTVPDRRSSSRRANPSS